MALDVNKLLKLREQRQEEQEKKGYQIPVPTSQTEAQSGHGKTDRLQPGTQQPPTSRTQSVYENTGSIHDTLGYARTQRTREAQQGLEKFRQDQARRAAEIQSRAGMMAKIHDNLTADGGSAIADAVSYGRNLVEDTSWQEPGSDWQKGWLEEFGLLYNADPKEALDYARRVNDYLKSQKLQGQQKKLGDTNAALAMGAGLLAAPLAMADPIEKVLEYAARGTITQRDHVTPATFSRDLTGAVGQRLNEEGRTVDEYLRDKTGWENIHIPVIGDKGKGDLYGIANSAIQSMGLGNVLGSAGTLATYFGQSAGAGMEEIKARGGSDEQAILYGLATGAFEAAAEFLPLERLLGGGDAVHYTLKSFMGNALKQAGMEGTEELATSVANELADRVIMGDKSNFNMMVRELMAQGMDEESAKKEAWKRFASDAAFDFLGGFASGGMSMAVQTGPSTIMANHQTRKAYTPEMDAALLEIAGEAEEGSRPYVLAQEYAKAEKLSGGQLNQLAGVYEEYTDAQEAEELTEAAREKLEAMDAEDDTVARAIAKKLTGQELNRRERRALERSAEGKKVLQDMQAEQELPATPEMPDVGNPWKAGNPMVRHYEQNLRTPMAPVAPAVQKAAPAVAQAVAEAAVESPVDSSVPKKKAAEVPAASTVTSAPAMPAEADAADGIVSETESTARTIEEVAREYGNQAKAISDLYQEGQDVEEFASAVRAAWEMGGSGIPMERVNSSPRTQGITQEQRRTAYLLGQGAARIAAQAQDTSNAKKATGGTVRRKGVVKAQSGITIDELSKTFNDRQRSAYKLLSFYAEVTGMDVVLYKGTREQETGRFAHGEDTVYIDITAGTNGWDTTDLSAYTMMRTFSHEFVHFVEKWSSEQYNHLREVVFSQMEKNGQDAEALVELAMQEQGLDFDQASREVVAEALTDILPDSQFVQTLASKHKSLFEKIRERLEAFVTELKEHFKKLTGNNSREAVALKRQVGEALGYAEEVLQAFDRAAGAAVETYQATVSKKETVREKPSEAPKPEMRVAQAAPKVAGETAQVAAVTAEAEAEVAEAEVALDEVSAALDEAPAGEPVAARTVAAVTDARKKAEEVAERVKHLLDQGVARSKQAVAKLKNLLARANTLLHRAKETLLRWKLWIYDPNPHSDAAAATEGPGQNDRLRQDIKGAEKRIGILRNEIGQSIVEEDALIASLDDAIQRNEDIRKRLDAAARASEIVPEKPSEPARASEAKKTRDWLGEALEIAHNSPPVYADRATESEHRRYISQLEANIEAWRHLRAEAEAEGVPAYVINLIHSSEASDKGSLDREKRIVQTMAEAELRWKQALSKSAGALDRSREVFAADKKAAGYLDTLRGALEAVQKAGNGGKNEWNAIHDGARALDPGGDIRTAHAEYADMSVGATAYDSAIALDILNRLVTDIKLAVSYMENTEKENGAGAVKRAIVHMVTHGSPGYAAAAWAAYQGDINTAKAIIEKPRQAEKVRSVEESPTIAALDKAMTALVHMESSVSMRAEMWHHAAKFAASKYCDETDAAQKRFAGTQIQEAGDLSRSWDKSELDGGKRTRSHDPVVIHERMIRAAKESLRIAEKIAPLYEMIGWDGAPDTEWAEEVLRGDWDWVAQNGHPGKPGIEAKPSEAQSIADDRFTIDATPGGTVYVTFPGKPDAAVRDALKARGFKWAGKKKAWYGKDDPGAVADALREAYKAPDAPKALEPAEPSPKREQKPAEPVAHADPYDRIREELRTSNKTVIGGYSYEVTLTPGAGYTAVIARDGRQLLNKWIDQRRDAIDYMVDVARNSGYPMEDDAPKAKEAAPVAEPVQEMEGATPSEKLANAIFADFLSKGRAMDSKALYALADKAFGGTQGQGAYDRKDAYDAMELAVNKHLLELAKGMNGDASTARKAVGDLMELLKLLPTQSVRTQEQQDFQQFSTPPNIAYLAAWAGNVQPGEMVLEPSAGIGGIAAFAKSWGAKVAVNELSKRRLGILERMGFDHIFNENAEQIDNVLPENIQPSLVLMNPPFSSTAGRTAHNKTSNAERHIDQALARLSDGGRLVAVLGKGMNDANYRKYWNKVRMEYTIRANLSIDGDNYKKYGTTWGVQLVVIDKTGPQTGQTVTGSFADLTQVPGILEEIRNDRKAVERTGTDGGEHRERMGVSAQRDGASEAGREGGRVGDPGKPARSAGKRSDGSHEGSRAVRDQSDDGGLRKSGADSGRGEVGRDVRADLRPDHRADHESSGAGELARPRPQRARRLTEEAPREDDGVYATFVIPEVPIPGGRKHPATLVESAAMSAVPMPKATYVPTLPADVVKNNLSDAQMVTVTYAGQAHSQMLPDGSRRGFFIGDGTGVGKGRQIAGIILDNFMQGRTKAVWVSKNGDLFGDAVRDWTGTTGRSKDEVLNHGKTKLNDPIKGDSGILFTTYPMLRSGKNNVTRLDQIVSWLGEDFDGVIAFDEAHNMGNLYGKKGSRGKTAGSEQAKAGVELQRRLPKARIVYVSATAATEVDNLAYAERLGLWGKGTAFSNAQDFISKIGSSGLAAMELVVRDMKAMGAYTARSISYQGVAYDTIEHTLDENQTIIYNTMSSAWQTVMQNVHKALELTGGNKNSRARANAMGQFYSSMQRFYNQALTSMSMPSVIADIRKELAAGHSCVLQIVNTNEAQQNKALAQAKAENLELDDLDLTPREALIGYLETCFPVQEFEEYTDEDGNLKSRPVTNSKGEPVISRTAVAMREALIEQINGMSIPDGPMEMLFDAFGTEMVAENTGRSRRVVPRRQSDGSIKRVEERRTLNSRTADVQAFQDGKKRILVFSDAGGTGKSYHADRSEKNQQQRIHYVLQPGWSASNAVQGFGRTHRSNEVSAPIYKLVTTNIKGQKRFTSTIARRLDQLGALTKGQRDTGSGMFGAKDNLETDLARDALREFYKRLGNNQFEGVDGARVIDRLGLKDKFYDEYGAFKLNEVTAREISTFLNRILALEVDEQNAVFDQFTGIYEMMLEDAIQKGTLDTGMENVQADRIEILDDKIIREDGNGGAATHYIQAKTYKRPKVTTTVADAENRRTGFVGIYEVDNGAVRAVYRMPDKTTEWGEVRKQYRLEGPNQGAKTTVWLEDTLAKRAKLLERKDWQAAWDKEVQQVPEYNEDLLHMLTGALLPIWNSLPQEGTTKVKRLIATDGSTYLGREIPAHMIDLTLRQFRTSRTMEQFTPRQVMDKALTGTTFDLSRERGKIFRSRVSGEWRIEIKQMNDWQLKRYPGLMTERINFQTRHFIPNSPQGEKLLEEILKNNPVRDVGKEDQLQVRRVALTDRQVLEMAKGRIDESKLTPAERDGFRIFSERLERLRTLQEDRAELGQLYKEQQFGKDGDRKAAAETLEKMHRLDDSIEAAANKVLEAERGAALRKVLQEARKVVQKDQADHDEAVLKEYRQRRNESAAQRKYRRAIQREVTTLREWLVHPDNKNALKHIPDVLKGPVGSFIAAIDLTSTNGGTQADERMAKKMQAVLDAYKRHIDDVGGLYSGYTDLPPDFVDRLTEMVNKTWQIAKSGSGTYKIKGGEMSAADLRALYQLIREMKRHITTVNKFHANAMFQFASDAAQDTMQHLGKQGKHQNGQLGGADQFLFWKNVRPAYIFERFGKGGMAIYDGLRRGQGQLARNTEVIKKFADRAYTAQEVNAWEKEIKTVRLPGEGGKIRLTVAQIMSLYCLSKREQAVPHLLGGGIRGANIQGTDTEARHLTPEDLQAIIGRLSKRQRAVADSLQKFMSEQGGEWGNAVTVKRFGERQLTEEHYFPISTDGQLRNAEADKPDGSDLYALLNMSFTKKLTPNANNRVMLYSVFDVFANHMAGMAQYNAMALPVLDALKWFNYRDTWKTVDGKPAQDSVREQMVRAFGAPVSKGGVKDGKGYAETFVLNILRSYNGTEAQGTPNDGLGMQMLHRYNRAQVAWNASVVLKQPLAILRAAQEIPYAAIMKGMAASPARRKQDIAEMLKHSGIAAWKNLGFYDVNISRGLGKLIKHNDTILEKYVEKGMAAAEWADRQTWGAIWHACKEQTGGNLEKTAKLFEDVIYKTQVVDSILTKTEYMRDKGFFSRLTSSFMSEPVTAVSPFLETAFRIKEEASRKGGSFQTAWQKHGGKLGRYAYVYAVTAVLTAALQSVIDAWRDDDDYQTFWEKMQETFAGNIGEELDPFEKIPVVKEIATVFSALGGLAKGESVWLQVSTLPLGDVAEYTVDATEILFKKLRGENTSYTWYGMVRKYLQAASGLTGIPGVTPVREAVDIWNNLVGRMAPSLKVKVYERNPADELRDAFLGGYVDEEEATAKLQELGKAKDENEAYWKLRGWENGSGWDKYDALAQAMANGEDISEEMDELTTHGVKEKTVRSQIRTIVGEWLAAGAISEAEARSLLMKYGERDGEEADEAVMKWRCEIDTGIPFTGIKEAYLDGEITADRAKQMYEKYGGYDPEKAVEAVERWRAEKETGTAYDDIAEAVLDGELSENQAAQMYVDYGGYEAAEAQEMAHRLAFIRDNPGCPDISSAAVADYEDYCKGAGIGAKTFYDAWKRFNDTHSIKDENGKTTTSKREQVMAQIDAMNLTAKQKDALYFAFGYAESKLWDTPWH